MPETTINWQFVSFTNEIPCSSCSKEFVKTFPELSEKFGELIRSIIKQPKMDKKVKELIITALLAAQQFESGFKFHVKEAQNRGATRDEILETILLLLPYGNVSSFLKSLWWIMELGIL